MAHLRGTDADNRFNWDAGTSIDLDVVDLRFLRGTIFADVGTIIGNEQRSVDPNQNSYTFDVSASLRLPRGELATIFHHVSRHLIDRATTASVSWNMVGASYADRFRIGDFAFEAGARGMGTVGRNSVDYEGQFEGYLTVARSVNARLAIIASADGVIVPVEAEILGRDTKRGGRLETGLRLLTGTAMFDMFVAWEQRIDAGVNPLDSTRWTQIGFRLTAPAPFGVG